MTAPSSAGWRTAVAVLVAVAGAVSVLGLLFAAWLSGTNLGGGASDLTGGELLAYGAGLAVSTVVPALAVRALLGRAAGALVVGGALAVVGVLGFVLLGL